MKNLDSLKNKIQGNIIAAINLKQNIEEELAFCRGMIFGAYYFGNISASEFIELIDYPELFWICTTELAQ
jgi:hypothetical protein